MNLDKSVVSFAGAMVLAGVALGYWVSPWGYALSALIGLNLFQAGFTGFCPAAVLLKKLGVPPGNAFR
ncbi:conserved exported hypothetical protein [uncultured Alphaproteobacteria bacterium]|uniref:Inner membrane protein YgaP-like transmembrane domain-containing protein n=1 Tax=uncultured Alphaproteobacteria bacterium TaxID=91750 RepID=A0A212KI59_9PROT|nr:conserved exported hypothetical protein [uncultured Alphaproteobacteria bacterium]